MSDLVIKHFRGFEIKDAEKGEVEAMVSTLDVVDKDGDIIRSGAQGKTAKVAMSSWGHDAMYGNRPAGKGKLIAEGNTLKFVGRVFLNTSDGRDTFEVLKEMGEDQEWSFGFRVLGSEVPSESERKAGAVRVITKIDAFEVSPVLVGAGVGTHTMSVKSGEPPKPDAQADGAADPDESDEVKALAATVLAEVTARIEAERKAKEDEAAEAARIEAETKAKEDARIAAEALEAEQAATSREFERFQRTQATMRRSGWAA